MGFSPLVAVGTLVFTFVNFLTYVKLWLTPAQGDADRKKGLNGIVTQIIAWVAGVAAMLIAAHTQLASDIRLGSMRLSHMDWPSQVFLGLIATSILSTVNEVKKALDNNDSAAKTPLLGADPPVGDPADR